MLCSEWGSWAEGRQLQLGSVRDVRRWELLCAFRSLFHIFFFSVLLLLLFASFAVLLNCPYPDPRVFLPFFLSIVLPTPAGEGAIEQLRGPLLLAMGRNCKYLSAQILSLVALANMKWQKVSHGSKWKCFWAGWCEQCHCFWERDANPLLEPAQPQAINVTAILCAHKTESIVKASAYRLMQTRSRAVSPF